MPFPSTINVLIRDHVPKVADDNYLMRMHRYTGEEAYVEGSFEPIPLTWDFTEGDRIPEELIDDDPKPGCISSFTASSSIYTPASGWVANKYHLSIKDLMDKEAWYVSADGMSWKSDSLKADYMSSISYLQEAGDDALAKYRAINALTTDPSGTSNNAWKFWLLATNKLSFHQIMTYTFVYHDDINAIVLYMNTEGNTVHEDFDISMCDCKQYPDCKGEEEWPDPDTESTGFYIPPPVAIAAKGFITLARAKVRKEQLQTGIYSYVINTDDYIDDPEGLRDAIGNARAGWEAESIDIVKPKGTPIVVKGGLSIPASGWGYATRKWVRKNKYDATNGLQHTSEVFMNGIDITDSISSKKRRTFYKPLGKYNKAWQNYLKSVKKKDDSCISYGEPTTLYKLETIVGGEEPECPTEEPDCVGTCFTKNILTWSGVRTVYQHTGRYMHKDTEYEIFQGFRLHNSDKKRRRERREQAYGNRWRKMITNVRPQIRKLLAPPDNVKKFNGRTETTIVTNNDSMVSDMSVEVVFNYTKKNYSYFPFRLFNCTKNQYTELTRNDNGRVVVTSFATDQEIPYSCVELAPTYSSRTTTTERYKVYKDRPISELVSIESTFTIWFHYYTLRNCHIRENTPNLNWVSDSEVMGELGECGHWNDLSTKWIPRTSPYQVNIHFTGTRIIETEVISSGTKSGPFTDCWDMTSNGSPDCPWGCDGEEETLTLQSSGSFGEVVLKSTNYI